MKRVRCTAEAVGRIPSAVRGVVGAIELVP
jgi:hypothetical protein